MRQATGSTRVGVPSVRDGMSAASLFHAGIVSRSIRANGARSFPLGHAGVFSPRKSYRRPVLACANIRTARLVRSVAAALAVFDALYAETPAP